MTNRRSDVGGDVGGQLCSLGIHVQLRGVFGKEKLVPTRLLDFRWAIGNSCLAYRNKGKLMLAEDYDDYSHDD